jgi:hypothetical protein
MQLESSPSRLQLFLQRTTEEVFEPDAAPDAPLVRFAAYGAHQQIFGWVRLKADRLTDLLNAHDELQLFDVDLETFTNGLTGTVDEVVIRRRDLIAVQARGPRGIEERRRATRIHPIAIQSGNYLISGYLHAPPGADPIESVRSRAPMIPLTDASIEYWVNGKREHQSTGTIIVNRDATDWIRLVTHEDLIDEQLRLD